MLSVVFAVLLAPALARAQGAATVAVSITNPGSLQRLDRNDQPISKRQLLTPEGVNLQDCRDDQFIRFPLSVVGFASSDGFEVWATDVTSADCTVSTARTGATTQCYRIDANFSRVQTQSVDLRVKSIIKGMAGTQVDADGCRLVNNYSITVFFLVLRGTDIAGFAKATIPVDTQGPRPLSNVRALPGEAGITISWDAVGEAGAEDVIGAQAFCDPSPVGAGATEGGTKTVCTSADSGDASVDAADEAAADAGVTCTDVPIDGTAGGSIPAPSAIPSEGTACETQAFAPPSGSTSLVPDSALAAKYGCGSISGSTGNSIRVDSVAGQPLVNGTVYAVAVAATDSFGNIGELSSPLCQFPESTSDFWRDYRGAGGQAGGGYCSIEAPGVPVGSFSLMVVGIVVGLSSLRRVQRARRADRGRNRR